MSTYRNHRIVVASLFLPHTAVLSDHSQPGSPAALAPVPLAPKGFVEALAERILPQTQTHTPAVEARDPFAPADVAPLSPTALTPGAAAIVPSILRPKLPGPIKSIVLDLQAKSRNQTPLATPGAEASNPFLIRALKNNTTGVAPHHGPSRMQRKGTLGRTLRPVGEPGAQGWHVEPNPHANGGLHNAMQSVRDKVKKRLLVGTLGTATDGFKAATRTEIDHRMRGEHDAVPVWIPDDEFRKCYDEFCHQVLWPALHYAVPDAPKTKSFYESSAWEQYVSVNERFADAIAAVYEDGDVIFVNDYHLLLLPELLRARLPNASIGFFLHVSFPSSEIFRCLAVRQKLLRGVLAADLVGFQTAAHARHFRQTVSRVLALEATPRGIQTDARFVDVGVFPIGIDVGALTARRNEAETKEWIETLEQRYAGLKLIVGRDKLDEVQGVKHKLLAFEVFLERYPEFRNKVVLIQVALQTSETNEEHASVAAVVSRINSRFATLTYTPVVFLHAQDLAFAQYLALLTVADAFIVTSVREGMALRAHEFVECQETRHRPLILSEFTGSYTYRGFRSCIGINPWDKQGTAAAMYQALAMPAAEARARWDELHAHVVAQTAQAFVAAFLQRTLRAALEHGAGGAAGGPPHLELARVLPRYRHSGRRLLALDLEGTLWRGRDPRDAGARTPPEVVDVLRRLAADERNEVWAFSGLPVAGALEALAAELPDVGLVAENGCFIRPRAQAAAGGWISLVENKNLEWKSPCLEILHYFTERTPGAYVEERQASVVWRYWTKAIELVPTADRAWARRQAAEAQNHIFDSLGERFGLRIVPGANSFLVLPADVGRGAALATILDPAGPVQNPVRTPGSPRLGGIKRSMSLSRALAGEESAGHDFVFALSGDERLLRRLGEQEDVETVSTAGARASEARWTTAPEEALGVLDALVSAGGV